MKRLFTFDQRLAFDRQPVWQCQHFANGEAYVQLPEMEVDGAECTLLADLTPKLGHFICANQLAHTLTRAGAKVRLASPYLPYFRQDKPQAGQSLGLRWFTGLWQAAGVQEIIGLQVHDIRLELGPSDRVEIPITSLSAARPLAQAVSAGGEQFNLVVAPDQGAAKLAQEVAVLLSNHPPVLVMAKTRDQAGIRHQPLADRPQGRILVVDDIFDTGSTLTSCLHELGAAAEVTAAVVHGIFSRVDWDDLWSTGLRQLWYSDSLPPQPELADGRLLLYEALPVLREYLEW